MRILTDGDRAAAVDAFLSNGFQCLNGIHADSNFEEIIERVRESAQSAGFQCLNGIHADSNRAADVHDGAGGFIRT